MGLQVIEPFDFHSPVTWLRIGIALVWLVFGLLFKALGMMPRHRRIVARVVGERSAGRVTTLVAVGEVGLALWMLSGRFLPICMGVQTLALVAMNTLEIRYAKDLLVSPIGMICANIVLLSAGWYVALPHGFLLGPQHHHIRSVAPTEDELLARLGPALYSQGYEELIIRDFFDDAWRGVFVDVGAGHYREDSNTYFLERHRGWHGIAVDANVDYAADYAWFRPHTRFINAFVSDHAGDVADFAIAQNPVFSSGARTLPPDAVVKRVKVPTTTLDRILAEQHVQRFDFLSIDVEGAELAVLKGLDLRRYRPSLICIEIDPAARELIFAHLHAAGYRELDVYHALNEWNAYFTPR